MIDELFIKNLHTVTQQYKSTNLNNKSSTVTSYFIQCVTHLSMATMSLVTVEMLSTSVEKNTIITYNGRVPSSVFLCVEELEVERDNASAMLQCKQ